MDESLDAPVGDGDVPVELPVSYSGISDNDVHLVDIVNRLGRLENRQAELHSLLAHTAQGVGAIYTMVDSLVKMLSAVQQVASMMPGGKKIAQAMAAKNGGAQ